MSCGIQSNFVLWLNVSVELHLCRTKSDSSSQSTQNVECVKKGVEAGFSFKSCFGPKSRFWDVAHGEPCWQEPLIGIGCVWLPLIKSNVSNTGFWNIYRIWFQLLLLNKSSENTGYKVGVLSKAFSDRLQCFTLKCKRLTPFPGWKW